jgi:hypothetical protein
VAHTSAQAQRVERTPIADDMRQKIHLCKAFRMVHHPRTSPYITQNQYSDRPQSVFIRSWLEEPCNVEESPGDICQGKQDEDLVCAEHAWGEVSALVPLTAESEFQIICRYCYAVDIEFCASIRGPVSDTSCERIEKARQSRRSRAPSDRLFLRNSRLLAEFLDLFCFVRRQRRQTNPRVVL